MKCIQPTCGTKAEHAEGKCEKIQVLLNTEADRTLRHWPLCTQSNEFRSQKLTDCQKLQWLSICHCGC